MSPKRRAELEALVRGALLAFGLGLVGYFVVRTGPEQVLLALTQAGHYLPLLVGLELVMMVCDVKAFAALLGREAAAVPARSWVRSTAASYACLILLPAGRAASEVARAAGVAGHVGVVRAATAGAQLQAACLASDGLASAAVMGVLLAFGGDMHHLPAMLGANAALTLFGGVSLLVLVQHRRGALRLATRAPRLLGWLAQAEHPPTLGMSAVGLTCFARGLQVLQYGLAVLAVGGGFGMRKSAVAFGAHAVGATLGVAIPNQIGAADGAYLLFADTLGFGGMPARALAVMLSIRVAQVVLALTCLLVPLFVRAAVPARESP